MAPAENVVRERIKPRPERNPVVPLLSQHDKTLPALRRFFSPENAWRYDGSEKYFFQSHSKESLLDAQEKLANKAHRSHNVRVAIEEQLSTIANNMVVPIWYTDWEPYAKPRPAYRINGRKIVSAQSAVKETEPIKGSVSIDRMVQVGEIPENAQYAPSSVFISSVELPQYVHGIMARAADRTKKVTGFKAGFRDHDLLSDALLQASANRRFHLEVEEIGIPASYPNVEPIKSITIKSSRPEHLMILKGIEHKERRMRIAEIAQGLTEPHRSGSIIYSISHYEKIEETLSKYVIRNRPERLPENMTREQYQEAVELCQRLPEKGQISEYLNSLSHELSRIVLGAFSSYKPLPQEDLETIERLTGEIKKWHDIMLAQGYTKGAYWGQYLPEMLEKLDVELNFPELGIVENDITAVAGEPIAILGANGEGKTTVLAQVLQHQQAIGKALSSESHLPNRVELIAAADVLRLQGLEMMQKARSSGKSSFVIEVEQFIKRLDQVLAYGSKSHNSLPVVEGDEVGSKTDQLNAMALLATELIAAATKGTISFHASHYNSLPKVIGPLLKELGIKVQWKTMENHKIKDLEEGEEVKSNALEKSAPFLPEDFMRLWMEVADVQYTPLKFREEEPKREYIDFNLERLQQLGWINRHGHWKYEFTFTGIVSRLLSSDTSYQHQDFGKVAIVNTILDPRWVHIGYVPEWISRLREGGNREIAKPLETLNVIGKLYDDINKFKRYRKNDEVERDRIFAKSDEIIANKEVYIKAAREVAKILPGFPIESIIKNLSKENIHTHDMTDFSGDIHAAVTDIVALEMLNSISRNLDKVQVGSVNRKKDLGISITNAWNWELARNLKGEENVVKNSIDLDDTSVFFTGPQGSGKTEALFTLAENIQLGSMWGLSTSEKMSIGGRYEVIPLLSIPPEPVAEWNKPKRRPLSSLEREAADRIGLVVDICGKLPKGVRPVVILDEPFTSTNTKDAGEGTIAIKEYVESLGGILIVSTHFHDTLWQMEKRGIAYHAKQVELFDTPDQFRWTDGHGKSMGIEVAGKLGLDKRLLGIAHIIRGYLEQVTNEDPSLELIRETARLLAPIISEL